MTYLDNLLQICLDSAPWLLLGFLAAGLIKAWIPEGALGRWLGGNGAWPITKAALIGAPLPLCSCGVLPAALSLHRGGASRGSTVSFLIATPETGVDSIALSYALLGPVMAVVRPVAAVICAISTGLLAGRVAPPPRPKPAIGIPLAVSLPVQAGGDCCSGGGCCEPAATATDLKGRTLAGIRYALVEMVDDLLLWLSLGLGLAALVVTLVPPMAMAEWGSGLAAMVMMVLIGVPMYICATASTPVASALLLAGVSPGTVLVFLLAGPATNIATIAVIAKEMGRRVMFTYLAGIAVFSILIGLATDWLILRQGWDVRGQIGDATEWLPEWLVTGSALVLLLAVLNALLIRARGILSPRQAEG